jgi:carbon monoxide dehydrogenase subunit G
MTSTYREFVLDTDAAHAWSALRDPADVARAFAGVLVGCTLDGDVRTVTFANGNVIEERIVAIDEARMRIAYTILGGRFEHQHASMQIVPDGAYRCRFVWQSDFLPDTRREAVERLMDAGCDAFARNVAG